MLLRLLALPMTGPWWVIRQVIHEAERRYYDPQAILAQLSALARLHEAGELDQAEFEQQESLLMERLMAARPRRHP